MTQVYLGLGSNVDRKKNIASGLQALEKLFGSIKRSRIYESESVGFKGSHFFNLVVEAQTDLSIVELSSRLKKIEDENGRIRTGSTYSPRSLDIDILLYGNFVGIESGVELPRNEIVHNAFVLLPLSELAPNAIHPCLQKTYLELWQAYDKKRQALWDSEWNGNYCSE